MATTVARLQAILSADTGQFDKAMNRSETTMQKVGGGFQKAALPAAAALTAIGLGAKKAIDDASNLGEQMNKTAVVFGANGKEVQKWSKGLTKNFGMSQRAALEAAGTYGNMLKPMGILPAKTKEISTRMVELAGDMASFNNASPEQTLDALRAGLAGETEPLRKFGVFLNEATIKAEALSMGLVKAQVDTGKFGVQQEKMKEVVRDVADAMKKHGKGSDEYAMAVAKMEYEESKLAKILEGKVAPLTAAQKATASYSVITKSTSDAQGDFARTSESVANQQRIQAAETENLRAKMGQGLLPVYAAVQRTIISITGLLANHTTGTKVLVGVVAGLAVGILAVNVAMKAWAAATTLATAAQWLFNAALSANPIALVVLAVAALAAGVVIAYKKSETFRGIVDGLWANLKSLGGWMRENFPAAKEAFMKAIDPIVTAFGLWWKAIGKIIDGVEWLIGNIKRIPKFDIPFIGDARDPNMTAPHSGGGNLMGASPVMGAFAASAAGFGLTTTSGLRGPRFPGDKSDHIIGKALDVAGSSSAMASFFSSLIGNPRVKQAFYDPLGSIFGGAWNSYREGGHSDHVHVASYDKGGFLKPGLTLAYNGTGRNEPVGGGNVTIPVSIGGELVATVIWDQIRQKAQVFERRNRRSAF